MTEFKNASSDMKNATRTFMEAKDLVSRVKHARGYFPVVGVGAFDGFQTTTPRGSRQAGSGKGASTGMNSQTGKGRGRGLGKGKPPRDSRRPSPAKSRVTLTEAAKGGPTHGTRIQPGQCLLCRQMGHLARDCPNRGTRDDYGINLKRAFGSFVEMTGDRDVSLPVLTTTPQQDIVQYSDFNMSHVPVVIWLSLLVFVEQFLFWLVSSACVVKCKTRLFCWDSNGTTVNFTSSSKAATRTSNGADHRERYEVDQGLSLINSLQHFESFDEGYTFSAERAMSYTFSENLCRVGSLCGGRRQRQCAAGHWSIQISWRLHDGAMCD